MRILVELGLLSLLLFAAVESSGQKVVLCYFSSWATYRRGNGKFDVESIDPLLCTHAAYAFAGLNPSTNEIKVLDPYNDLKENWGKGGYERFNNMKKSNPNLKTLLSVGGWNEGATKYSKMVSSRRTRSKFIKSTIKLLLKHGFDGLDFDWEYPGGRSDSPGSPQDKINYVTFLKELRQALDEAGGLLLTAAVSAGKATIDKGYNVAAMGEYMDFINVMTYDYHGWWGGHHFTGHNSPLGPLPEEESSTSHSGHYLNANFSMNYYASKGAPKEKLLLGMGAYGRGYILRNPSDNGFYAKAISGIKAGPYTRTSGFWGFNEYCEKMKTEKSKWTVVRDPNVMAPYAYNAKQWFSYDDAESIRAKSKYVLDQGFGGSFVWSIDTDDFLGLCGGPKFPLLSAINSVFKGMPQPETTKKPMITEGSKPTTMMPETTPEEPKETHKPCHQETTESSRPDPHGSNNNGSGEGCIEETLIPDIHNCEQYISCVSDGMEGFVEVSMNCPPGLAFNPDTLNCDWMENVACP